MLTIPGHKENANQNDTGIPPHPRQNGCHDENKQQQMLVRIYRKRNYFHSIPLRNIPLKKAIWRSLQQPKIELPYNPVIHSWAYTQRKSSRIL
jgi:hypothetical protein